MPNQHQKLTVKYSRFKIFGFYRKFLMLFGYQQRISFSRDMTKGKKNEVLEKKYEKSIDMPDANKLIGKKKFSSG